MKYLRCDWEHTSPRLPVAIYAEFEDDGWETRKVEILPGGAATYADRAVSTGSTRLADQKVNFEEVLKGTASLTAAYTTKDVFDTVWRHATT